MVKDPRRYKLNDLLISALGSDQVYFNPPESVKMSYPAIVYSRHAGDSQFADNSTYAYRQAYDVTVIALDPDLVEKIDLVHKFDSIRSDRHYVLDNLHHDTFVIYF